MVGVAHRVEQGRRVGLYYGNGHLHFYHRLEAENFNSIVAVPWTPYAEYLTVDMSRAVVLRVPLIREVPYAWGQLHGEVLNCSNWGAGATGSETMTISICPMDLIAVASSLKPCSPSNARPPILMRIRDLIRKSP